MSHFYGVLENGINNDKTMRGFKNGTLRSRIASYSLGMTATVSQDSISEKDVVDIRFDSGNGSGDYKGSVSASLDENGNITLKIYRHDGIQTLTL